jgi:hypothetical protein
MARPPDDPLLTAEGKMRICGLGERIQAQEVRMASLDNRVRREDQRVVERLLRIEEAITALNVSLDRLLEESAVCHRAESALSGRLELIEATQAVTVVGAELGRSGNQSCTATALPQDSLSGEVSVLKGELMASGILAAWISV